MKRTILVDNEYWTITKFETIKTGIVNWQVVDIKNHLVTNYDKLGTYHHEIIRDAKINNLLD